MGSQSGAARLPERFGPFVLERRLAVGGSAEVYLARPSVGIRPAPRFVIKRPLPGPSSAEDFELLSREAELNQAVVHPNVVQVFGAGMVDGRPYLAMEYVDGVDAFRLLRTTEAEARRLELGVAIYIARRVADALASVHRAAPSGSRMNLVHGDVSPSNIYLSSTGDVKLGDFGIARIADDPEREEVKGKWGYVAPEVLEGEPPDHRADLFSLGAVLGELLLGESIFPGSSQLAVLLAIREANIEPLRRRAGDLPRGLFEVLERSLNRDPLDRPAAAEDLYTALSPYEPEGEAELRATLGRWVDWARDPARLAQRIEGRVRDSVARMQASRTAVVSDLPPDSMQEPVPLVRTSATSLSTVRRAGGEVIEGLPFAKLIGMIAVGDLDGHDEVALMGEPFRRIDELQELSRHLLPSTTTTTGVLFGPRLPDYAAQLDSSSMLEILARLREKAETGALFVEQGTAGPSSVRKEIYVQAGRLHHVASSAREELLGEYLVRRGKLSREGLESALAELGTYSGRLGDTLVAMKLVDVMDLFRAIRDQGRDRVGALCAWKQGKAAFYRGTQPGAVQFPLDLDLTSAMMSGAILAAEGKPELLLPGDSARVVPGPRAALAADRRERGTAPRSLQLVPSLLSSPCTVAEAVAKLVAAPGMGRSVGEREARAALVVSQALGWAAFEP